MDKADEKPGRARSYWMSVDERGGHPVRDEFDSRDRPGEMERREFLQLGAASALLASMAGCTRRPLQKIVPYVTNPEEIIPGLPNFYTSADPQSGYGLLVRCREGRPVKVDGNPDHPLNRGALSPRGQAMVHDLYDPDRVRGPRIAGQVTSWAELDSKLREALAAGRGRTWLLTSLECSPTLKRVLKSRGIRHVKIDPLGQEDLRQSQEESYGERIFPRYRFDRADYILSLGANFLDTWGSSVEYSRQFADRRRLRAGGKDPCRLVMLEVLPTITGLNADLRHPLHPSNKLPFLLALAREVSERLGVKHPELAAFRLADVAAKAGIPPEDAAEIVNDLVRHRGRGLVITKFKGPEAVAMQNTANYLNSLLGNEGSTVDGTRYPSLQFETSQGGIETLSNAIAAGEADTLIIDDINPVYLIGQRMRDLLAKIPRVVYLASYLDETAECAQFVAARSHPLEQWGDVNPQKGLFSIVQPTIRPLWETRSLLECLLAWTSPSPLSSPIEASYSAVRETWRELHGSVHGAPVFEDWWTDCLMAGMANLQVGAEAASPPRPFNAAALKAAAAIAQDRPRQRPPEGRYVFDVIDGVLRDGAQANNALLQELPDPVSKNTWGNYLAVSPTDALREGWADGDVVRVESDSRILEIPLFVQPGHCEGVVSTMKGYGRRFAGRVGNGVGVSVTDFASPESGGPRVAGLVPSVRVTKTGEQREIACTQKHDSIEGRPIAFETTLAQFRKNPRVAADTEAVPQSLWKEHSYSGYRWGMAIDLSTCTGCSACVVACSVENNVPSVGRDQVLKSRKMHWLRIDRYFSGDPANPQALMQPMLCQHCENAPCETVCPVLATVHSDEGLNQMIYNRCVGTKYCSNNCPYKVRRFNWFNNNGDMNGQLEHPLPLKFNPEVTLRSRGVMEKCTFCVQRIEAGKSKAKTEGRRASDDDIRTACQDACPSGSIVFGDSNNPASALSLLRKEPHTFSSLAELNVRPQITYLAKIRNPPSGQA